MPRRHSRTSFSHALRRIVRATEDLVDDALDRAGDFECGIRRSVSRALDDDDHDDRDRDRDDRDRDDWHRDDRDRHRDRDDRDRGRRRDRDRDRDDWDDDGPRRRGPGDGRRREDRPRHRYPDEDEPYRDVPGPRLSADPAHSADQGELEALRGQLGLLRGRMARQWPGGGPDGPAAAPRSPGGGDLHALKEELARLADRIDRMRGN
ncbi:hypothetical protein AB0E74_25505 [Streptomyces sp. NPDC030392]|uniref:hypothetical protein n=1 Tax=Streptomyces sp. NPDC030392 TaxID=3155468 RepID=UPI0033EFCA08